MHADRETLPAALVEVAELSFFGAAEPCPPGVAPEEAEWPGPWLHASVGFSSDSYEGWIAVALPRPLACELTAAFAGCEPSDLAEDTIRDAAGELCNMVCGLWLTRTCPFVCFTLQPPRVVDGDAPGRPDGWTFVRLGGMVMGVSARGEGPR